MSNTSTEMVWVHPKVAYNTAITFTASAPYCVSNLEMRRIECVRGRMYVVPVKHCSASHKALGHLQIWCEQRFPDPIPCGFPGKSTSI